MDIFSIDRIGRRKDTASGIETGMNSSLGDGHSLLHHHFVDGDAIFFGHFVKFVNANDSN